MKKLFLLLLLIPVFILPSCKKGEEDPFLTMRSRENRITGSWNLVSLMGSSTYLRSDGEEIMENYYYDENVNDKLTRYLIILTSGVRYDYYYEFFDINMYINKDQTNECSYSGKGEGFYHWTNEGDWRWGSQGKKKEYVDLEALEYVYEGKTLYRIKRLSENELILVLEFTDNFIDEYDRDYNVEGTHTFTFRKVE